MTDAAPPAAQIREPGPAAPEHEVVAALLGRATADAEALLMTLRAEHDALSGHDPELLEQAVAGKARLVMVLDEHEKARAALTGTDIAGWQATLPAPAQAVVAAAREPLRRVLEQCRELNGINGRMVSRVQQSTHTLLDLMRGGADTRTYTQGGTQAAQRPGQSIGRA